MCIEWAYFAKNLGLKTLFDIGINTEDGSGQTLLVELGKAHCCYAYLQKTSNNIGRIHYTTYPELETEIYLPEILQPLKDSTFESVAVCSAFPQALLFPYKQFKNDYSALTLIYDQPAQDFFHDSIPEWQIVNAYSMPQSVTNIVQHAFPSVKYLHAYTPAIKIYNGYVADNQLSVHFMESDFRVLLKKDRMIQLVQTYAYKTPLDVIYYLLKICYEFNLSQQDVYLVLSGLIERDSNLFTDLQQYFTNIHFVQQPEISLPENPHPHYFFTSMYNLAACVL